MKLIKRQKETGCLRKVDIRFLLLMYILVQEGKHNTCGNSTTDNSSYVWSHSMH